MEGMEKAFRDALEKDPYDVASRWAYADWLSDAGRDDEAAWERSWTPERQQAVEYLHGFAARLRTIDDYPPPRAADDSAWDGRPITYDELMAAARESLRDGWSGTLTLQGFSTPEFAYDEVEQFWDAFALATGVVAAGEDRRRVVGCTC